MMYCMENDFPPFNFRDHVSQVEISFNPTMV